MRVLPKKNSKIAELIINHVKDNLKAYTIVSIILLIGIIFGVLFVNNMNQTQKEEVQTYLTDFTVSLKDGASIDRRKASSKINKQ